MGTEHEDEARCRERRYQWIVNTLLVLLGFFCGMLFETERIKSQVVANTVEIRMIRETLDDIQAKLNLLIQQEHNASVRTIRG